MAKIQVLFSLAETQAERTIKCISSKELIYYPVSHELWNIAGRSQK